MGKYKLILFDLDGTLSDPKEGITRSVQYALEKMGIEEFDLELLESFIGPPLYESFKEKYQFDENQIIQAIEFYRERFKEVGMYENKLYIGIPELLQSLKQNHLLIVATSKPTVFSEQILDYFQIEGYFDLVVGSNLDGTRSAKSEIIQFILDQYPTYDKTDVIMIGDRKHDLIGATNNGIDSIGVTYGYGSDEELKSCNPTFIVESVSEIERILLINK